MNKRILIYFPTNIGDTIIGLPVLDAMRANYPAHSITAIASRHTQEFLRRNTFINEVLLFDKAWPVSKKIIFSFSLWGKYDIFVDLKNSFLPVIAGSLKRTPFYRKQTNNVLAKDAYLRIVARLARLEAKEKSDFSLNDAERKRWEELKLSGSIFIACSSRSSQKSYPRNLLKTVIDTLSRDQRITILGEERDREHYGDICTGRNVVDLVGKTTLYDIAYLLRHYARLLLCVDSSILQLGSYYDVPIVALFGPTDPSRYGPWSKQHTVVRVENLTCAPCRNATCYTNNECMEIAPSAILKAVAVLSHNKKDE